VTDVAIALDQQAAPQAGLGDPSHERVDARRDRAANDGRGGATTDAERRTPVGRAVAIRRWH
jgi:hypothetical protein